MTNPNQSKSLPLAMASVHPSTRRAMLNRLNAALAERVAFEHGKLPNSAHIELRKVRRFVYNNSKLAEFLCVLGADPHRLLNHERKAGYRTDLKGFQKIKSLLNYATGESGKFERVSTALFAATIIAAKEGREFVTNNELELILSNCEIGTFAPELQDAIRHWQHRYMSIEGDSRPQACRWRTTFDNLGVYEIEKHDSDDSSRNGVRADLTNPVIEYLANRWGI